jgi:hypothetical protein
VTEVYEGPEGVPSVRVVAETDWYRWSATGQTPNTRALPAAELWLE